MLEQHAPRSARPLLYSGVEAVQANEKIPHHRSSPHEHHPAY